MACMYRFISWNTKLVYMLLMDLQEIILKKCYIASMDKVDCLGPTLFESNWLSYVIIYLTYPFETIMFVVVIVAIFFQFKL